MQKKIKSCWNCTNCVHFIAKGGNHILFCMLAKMYLPKSFEDNQYIVECDYYRDYLHDNIAMVRSIKENDQTISGKE